MPRKAKTNRIGPLEEAENAKALDAAAGVASPEIEVADAAVPPVPLKREPVRLVADTREKLLYKYSLEGPNISAEFFKDFTDSKELAELVCMMGMRRMAKVIATASFADADVKDFSALMRIILNIAYGETASMDPNKFMPEIHTEAIPAGGTEGLEAAMDKMRKFAGGKK
jgi:hypothetical protein